MKNWWQNAVKDYLTFTARERRGMLIILTLTISAALLFRFLPIEDKKIGKDNFQEELAQLKITIDSSHNYPATYGDDENFADYSRPQHYDYSQKIKGELFAFDPNTLNEEGWKRLGVRDKTINTIKNFLAKGYRFRRPEDVAKIYGLRKDEAERLMPYIHIADVETAHTNSFTDREKASYTGSSPNANNRVWVIDINTADTNALIALPGIGSKLASRIVNFRQKLGGFRSVDQLAETYGLPDSTFQHIKPRLKCSPVLKTININTADVNELRTHPYLKWHIANAIVNYRKQHGNYKSVEDIRQIDIITDELFNKIAPYLAV